MQNADALEIEKAKRLKLQELLTEEAELDRVERAKAGRVTRNTLNKRQSVRAALVDDVAAKKALLDALKSEVEQGEEQQVYMEREERERKKQLNERVAAKEKESQALASKKKKLEKQIQQVDNNVQIGSSRVQ